MQKDGKRSAFHLGRDVSRGSAAIQRPHRRRFVSHVRREKAALFQWVQGPLAIALAGSNRGRHGGDEMSEAHICGSNRCESISDTRIGLSARRRFVEPARLRSLSNLGQISSDDWMQASRSFSSNGLLK